MSLSTLASCTSYNCDIWIYLSRSWLVIRRKITIKFFIVIRGNINSILSIYVLIIIHTINSTFISLVVIKLNREYCVILPCSERLCLKSFEKFLFFLKMFISFLQLGFIVNLYASVLLIFIRYSILIAHQCFSSMDCLNLRLMLLFKICTEKQFDWLYHHIRISFNSKKA